MLFKTVPYFISSWSLNKSILGLCQKNLATTVQRSFTTLQHQFVQQCPLGPTKKKVYDRGNSGTPGNPIFGAYPNDFFALFFCINMEDCYIENDDLN